MSMARWIIRAHEDGVLLSHQRSFDMREFICGWAAVTPQRAVEWVAAEGHWNQGDFIELPDGSRFVFGFGRGQS